MIIRAPFKVEIPPGRTRSGKTYWQVTVLNGGLVDHHKFGTAEAALEFHTAQTQATEEEA